MAKLMWEELAGGADYYILQQCAPKGASDGFRCGHLATKTAATPPTNIAPFSMGDHVRVVGWVGTKSYTSDVAYLTVPEPGMFLPGLIVLAVLHRLRRIRNRESRS